MNHRQTILVLAEQYRQHRCQSKNMSLARLSTLIFNHGARLKKIDAGANFTVKSYDRAIQYFSNNWPVDLDWPADTPRPPKTQEVA